MFSHIRDSSSVVINIFLKCWGFVSVFRRPWDGVYVAGDARGSELSDSVLRIPHLVNALSWLQPQAASDVGLVEVSSLMPPEPPPSQSRPTVLPRHGDSNKIVRCSCVGLVASLRVWSRYPHENRVNVRRLLHLSACGKITTLLFMQEVWCYSGIARVGYAMATKCGSLCFRHCWCCDC